MKCFRLSLLALLFSTANAQFGLGKKKAATAVAAEEGEPPVDVNDPALIEAMQIFANMSPEEMVETMEELKEMLGDDPETLAAIEQVVAEIPKMKAEDIQSNLKEMIAEDEVQAATNMALQMLQDNENAWETVWEKRDDILQAVLESGQVAPMDAVRFKADPKEWEAELKHIWEELQKTAASRKSSQ